MKMVRISSGSFLMGSPLSESTRSDDERQHQVTLTRDFLLASTEVTQAQWRGVMGGNPSHFTGDDLPVERVSWFDAVEFCNKLSDRDDLTRAYRVKGKRVTWDRSAIGYRLPTESEWEYACRAGSTTPFHFGGNITPDQVNYDGDDPLSGGREGQDRRRTVSAGSLPANTWGLHEMHGNVYEWCWDWYGDFPSGSVTDPIGLSSGDHRVKRGGAWSVNAQYCRSANRNINDPDKRYNALGLRLARSMP